MTALRISGKCSCAAPLCTPLLHRPVSCHPHPPVPLPYAAWPAPFVPLCPSPLPHLLPPFCPGWGGGALILQCAFRRAVWEVILEPEHEGSSGGAFQAPGEMMVLCHR